MLLFAGVWVCLIGCNGGDTAVRTGYPIVIETDIRPWNTSYSEGWQITTDHYRLYTTVRARPLQQYLPGMLEAAYKRYLDLTGLSDRSSAKRMAVYVMSTRQEWAALTTSRLGNRAGTVLSITAGGYCYDGVCVLWNIGPRATLSVASHEGLHQFFSHRLKQSLPMWLEEGMCVLSEGHNVHKGTLAFTPKDNPSRMTALRTAIINEHWQPIARLLPMDGGDAVGSGSTEKAVGYYGQVWALMRYIRSVPEYRRGLERLIQDAESGRLHEGIALPKSILGKIKRRGRTYNRTVSIPLFQHYITDDMETFEREYLAFSRKLVSLK